MTRNQIAFWTLQEQKRNNAAQLAELSKHNRQTEEMARATLAESRRHSIEGEKLARDNLNESVRHSTATEAIQSGQLAVSQQLAGESARHNLVSESISQLQAEESMRANRAQELLSEERNRLSQYANETQRVQVRQSGTQGDVKLLQSSIELIEDRRHNAAQENIQRQSSVFSLLGSLVNGVMKLSVGGNTNGKKW